MFCWVFELGWEVRDERGTNLRDRELQFSLRTSDLFTCSLAVLNEVKVKNESENVGCLSKLKASWSWSFGSLPTVSLSVGLFWNPFLNLQYVFFFCHV